MQPSVVRALEDLLRQVLRAPSGIDVGAVNAAVRDRAVYRRQRRQVHAAALLTLALALVVVGGFAARVSG